MPARWGIWLDLLPIVPLVPIVGLGWLVRLVRLRNGRRARAPVRAPYRGHPEPEFAGRRRHFCAPCSEGSFHVDSTPRFKDRWSKPGTNFFCDFNNLLIIPLNLG